MTTTTINPAELGSESFIKVYPALVEKLGTQAALVYGALEHHCNQKENRWRCWPSLQRLAEITGYGRTLLKRMLGVLEEAGLIKRKKRADESGSQQSNVYMLPGRKATKTPPVDGGRETTAPRSRGDCPPVARRPRNRVREKTKGTNEPSKRRDMGAVAPREERGFDPHDVLSEILEGQQQAKRGATCDSSGRQPRAVSSGTTSSITTSAS